MFRQFCLDLIGIISGMQEQGNIWECGRVLVVEDNKFSSMILTEMLRTLDCFVLEVASGEQALQLIDQNPDISLVMLDMNLPDLDGYEITRMMKSKNSNLKIVAQTGNILDSEKLQAMEAGCDDYITKPINLGRLREIIRKFCLTT